LKMELMRVHANRPFFRPFVFWLIGVCGSITGLAVTPELACAEVVDRIVAVVNDDIILMSELDEALKPYAEKLRNQGYDPEKQRQVLFRVREDLIEQLVEKALTDQEIKRNQLEANPKEVEAMIERIKEVNFYTDEDLRGALQLQGLTLDAYRDKLKEQVLRNKLVNLEIKSKIVITKQDVQAYYEAHRETFSGQVQYHLRNLFMHLSPLADESEKDQVREKIQTVLAKLEAGVGFAELAAEYSDSSAAENGGDLGLFNLDSLSEEIRDQIKDLKPGQYTPVLETDQGFQIIYLEDIVQSGGKTLEEATPEIEDKLFNEIMNKKFAAWLEDLRSRSHIKIIK
jgi:peptidyl-prolyl cis-trans isomerase SurA